MNQTLTEALIQKGIVDVLEQFGFSCYHTRFALDSDSGFPDIVAVREDGAIVAVECKGPRGQLRPAAARLDPALSPECGLPLLRGGGTGTERPLARLRRGIGTPTGGTFMSDLGHQPTADEMWRRDVLSALNRIIDLLERDSPVELDPVEVSNDRLFISISASGSTPEQTADAIYQAITRRVDREST